MQLLHRGDIVPHFEVTRHGGGPFEYSSIWQRKTLVLVLLEGLEPDAATSEATALMARQDDFAARDAVCVVTSESVAGVAAPAVVVADRWGEIAHVQSSLPSFEELLGWADYVRHRCPECEGEAR